jgi:hypothetical protein
MGVIGKPAIFALAVLVEAAISPSYAASVRPAELTVQLAISNFGAGVPDVDDLRQRGSTSVSVTGTNGGASGTVDANLRPAPIISSNISVSGAGQALAYGFLMYYFKLEGQAGVEIPVTISASSSLAPNVGEADQNFSLLYLGIPFATAEYLGHACRGNGCGTPGYWSAQDSFSVNRTLMLMSNVEYNLQMTLQLGITILANQPDTFSTSGYIDPIITIDPFFANDFSLVLSEGAGNQLANVPVPAALPLFATALIGGGVMAWRKKRKQKAEALAA